MLFLNAQRIQFEGFEADLRSEELLRAGRKVRLPPQSFHILAMLLERAGQLVTREEMKARLWPAGSSAEYDQALNVAVNRLREALRDSAEAPRYIETLPKRGYRFIAPIEPHGVESASAPDLKESGPPEAPAASFPRVALEPVVAGPPSPMIRSHRRLWIASAAAVSAVLALAGILAAIRHHSVKPPSLGSLFVPLTSLPGQELAPSFSPDGSQIAFAWNGETGRARQFNLYVKALGSERLLRLTEYASAAITPAWSPDGTTIAFLRETERGAGLYVIPALGGAERRIVDNGVAVGSFEQISWSPDGRMLAYSAYGPNGAAQVRMIDMDSLQAQPLSPAPDCLHAIDPAFSPDGRQIALVCFSSAAVYSIDLVGLPHGPLRRIARLMGNPRGLAWAPDGNELILANDPGDGGELWELSLDGRLSRLPFGDEVSGPVVALRTRRLAYVHGRDTVDIWRAPLAAAPPEVPATKLIYSTRSQTLPRYSLDGSHIVFESNRSGSSEIWMTDAHGGAPVRLTSFDGPSTSGPSWCSDGNRIAFDSRASGISAIYIEDVSERVPRKLVTSREDLFWPQWSEDCRWLFAIDDKDVLYRFPASGGPAERFAEHFSSYAMVAGDQVIFNVTGAAGVTLWKKSVTGGQESALENMPELTYADAWTATPRGVYFTDSSSKPITINLYDFASRRTAKLTSVEQVIPPHAGPGIAVSPDGRWLLYSAFDDQQSDIISVPAP